MVQIGNAVGRQTVAVISDMEQPLGLAVGNVLEVQEAIATLRGEGPADLRELCLALGGEMLALARVARSADQGRARLQGALSRGEALGKLREMVRAQGGDPQAVDRPDRLPRAPVVAPVPSPGQGSVASIDAQAIGLSAMRLGAGRMRKEDAIDPAVGIVLRKKVGEPIRPGEALAEVHAPDEERAAAAAAEVQAAYTVTARRPARRPLVHEVVA
jgi:thymidine phosphorylase